MSVPYLFINSITYSSSVLTLNTNYSYLRGGGSFSIVGFPSTLYYSLTNSYGNSISATFAISLSASRTFHLTFSFIKGPMINYPLDQISNVGITGGTSYLNGAYPYNAGFSNPPTSIIYEVNRYVGNYVFLT